MRVCVMVVLVVLCSTAGIAFGDDGKANPGRLLSAGMAGGPNARQSKTLALSNYSASVATLKRDWQNLEVGQSTDRGKSAFAGYSSVFGQASSGVHRVSELRKIGMDISDYERASKEIRERIENQKATDADNVDSRYIDLNRDELKAIKCRYHEELVAAERELRTLGKMIEKNNRETKVKVNKNEKLEASERARYNERVDAIEKIEQTIAYNSIDDILQSYDDYDDYFFKFDLGYEFTTVNTTFSKGNPRIDFFLYHRYSPYTKADKEYGGMFDIHTSLAARLTGSEEASTDTTNLMGTSGTAPKLGDKKSLDYDINVFMSVLKTPTIRLDGRYRLYSLIGPILVYGGKKVDDKNQIDQRLYGGLRLGISPEMYTDVLYGKTESRASRRLEIRGQMPIYRKENGSQVLLGAIANLGVTDRDKDNGDVVTIYAVWNIDVKDFFNIFK